MKLDQVNSSVLQNMLKNTQRQTGKSANAATQQGDEVSLSHSARLGNRIIQFSLSQSLTLNGKSYSVSSQEKTDDDSSESLFDYQKVADNVLSFVTNTIRARQQAGDDNEALKKMLGQAYKGIDKGFSDARAELDKSGQLSDPLKEGIDKSYELIQKGMSEFEEELFGKAVDSATTDTSESTETTDADTAATDQVKTPKEIGNSILAAMAGKQSASLELTTKEGDKVTIQFDDQQQWQLQGSGKAKKALQAYGELAGNSQNQKKTDSSASAYYSRTTQFSFKVEGDLSSSELKSISDIISKVGDLSDSFFGGNISDAVQQAQQLDLTDSELVSMSLDLYQQQAIGWQGNSNTATTNTGSDATAAKDSSALTDNQQAAAALPDVFSQLGDYLTQLQSMFNQMIADFNPDMQGSLQSWVAKQQHPEKSDEQISQFVSFNQHMQQVMAALQSGDSGSETDRTVT